MIIPAENPVIRWSPRGATGGGGETVEITRVELSNLNGQVIAERDFAIENFSDAFSVAESYNFGSAYALDLSGLVEAGRNYGLALRFSRTTILKEGGAVIETAVEHTLSAGLAVVSEPSAARSPSLAISRTGAAPEADSQLLGVRGEY